MAGNKIIHVQTNDGRDYYFGSLVAIFDVLTPEEIGISYDTLVNLHKIRPGNPYTNSKCTIKAGELFRHRTNRKNPNVK